MSHFPRTLIILRDTREKIPLVFPEHLTVLDPHHLPETGRTVTIKLHVVDKQIETADYAIGPLQDGEARFFLEGHRQSTIVERKRGIDELANNCLNAHGRAKLTRVFRAMREGWSHPILFLEGDPTTYNKGTRQNPDPCPAIDAFLDLTLAYDIPIHLVSLSTIDKRRAAGTWVARLLVRGALTHGRTESIPGSINQVSGV